MASSGEQAHICRLAGDHRLGLECLSDGQLLPILLAMEDPDTLLSCGGANRRLHRLVCDMRVWRHLLKGIESFTHQRLVELAEFGKNDSCLEMMTAEVVKEVASRFEIRIRSFKVAVSIQGWGAPVTYEMVGEEHLEELNQAAQTVGAKFTIKEVKADRFYDLATVAGLVTQQEEGLHKLELDFFSLCSKDLDNCISLLKASEEWKIQTLSSCHESWEFFSPTWFSKWAELARSAPTGHIGTMEFLFYKGLTARASMEDMKSVWEIAETLEVDVTDRTGISRIRIGGGRGENPKTTWEEAYETVLNLAKLCK